MKPTNTLLGGHVEGPYTKVASSVTSEQSEALPVTGWSSRWFTHLHLSFTERDLWKGRCSVNFGITNTVSVQLAGPQSMIDADLLSDNSSGTPEMRKWVAPYQRTHNIPGELWIGHSHPQAQRPSLGGPPWDSKAHLWQSWINRRKSCWIKILSWENKYLKDSIAPPYKCQAMLWQFNESPIKCLVWVQAQ